VAVSRFRATEYKNALSMTSSHDDKLVAVTRAVLQLPIERRNIVLRRIASRLPIYGTGCSDSDFDKAMRVVLRELILRMALQDLAQHVDALKRRSSRLVQCSPGCLTESLGPLAALGEGRGLSLHEDR
jgi:hypothetical protein